MIEPATLGPLSYVMANLRGEDAAEIDCQMKPGTPRWQIARWVLDTASHAWIVRLRGNPEAAFGFTPINVVYYWAWSFGTKRFTRCAPEMTHYLIEEGIPTLLEAGMIGAEARSLLDHEEAHAWIERFGAKRCGYAYPYGRNGEHFVTYRLTVAGYRTVAEQHRARRR